MKIVVSQKVLILSELAKILLEDSLLPPLPRQVRAYVVAVVVMCTYSSTPTPYKRTALVSESTPPVRTTLTSSSRASNTWTNWGAFVSKKTFRRQRSQSFI